MSSPRIDFTQPLETIPDERNPHPIPCILTSNIEPHDYGIRIGGDWFSSTHSGLNHAGHNFGHEEWYYNRQTQSAEVDWLPRLRNVQR